MKIKTMMIYVLKYFSLPNAKFNTHLLSILFNCVMALLCKKNKNLIFLGVLYVILIFLKLPMLLLFIKTKISKSLKCSDLSSSAHINL